MVSHVNDGPLAGVNVLELAALGPASFACMLLADMGASVTRVDRAAAADFGAPVDPRYQLLNRGRRSIAVDLKSEEGIDLVKSMLRRSDVLVEGYRPGATERMGLGPDVCLALNPQLVYGRMTGWGQDHDKRRAKEAGFDEHLIKPVDLSFLQEVMSGMQSPDAGARIHLS